MTTMTRNEMTAVDQRLASASERLRKATDTLRYYLTPRKTYRGADQWPTIDAWASERIDKAVADRRAAIAERDELSAIWRANGMWSRFFLVTNGNGHVHRETNCSTCFPTTRFAWLVELAGADEAEMVATYGSDACTVCFPSAPALPGFNTSRTKKEKEARAAERAAKRAAKVAKEEVLKVKRMERDLVERIQTARFEGKRIANKNYVAESEAAIEPLATKIAQATGVGVEDVIATATAKARAKERRDLKEAIKYAPQYACHYNSPAEYEAKLNELRADLAALG